MAIEIVKCRAKVRIGDFTAGPNEPHVQSFTVNRSRNTPATCSASVKVRIGGTPSGTTTSFATGGSGGGSNSATQLKSGTLEIWAGANGKLPKIFTGYVKTVRISPCFDDPSYVILSITGVDALAMLENKKYTRRCRAALSSWVSIEGVARRGLKSTSFAYRQKEEFDVYDGDTQKAGPISKARSVQVFDTSASPAPPRNQAKGHVQIIPLSISAE